MSERPARPGFRLPRPTRAARLGGLVGRGDSRRAPSPRSAAERAPVQRAVNRRDFPVRVNFLCVYKNYFLSCKESNFYYTFARVRVHALYPRARPRACVIHSAEFQSK